MTMATETDTAGEGGPESIPDVSGSFASNASTRLLYVLAPWFYPLYTRYIGRREQFVLRMKRRLAAAHITLPVEIYLAGALGCGVLTGIGVGGVFGALVVAFDPFAQLGPGYAPSLPPFVRSVWDTVKLPLLALVGLFVGIGVGVLSAFASAVVVPKLRIHQRRREINLLLPDAIAFMYALSVGGMDQMQIIAEIADSEETYGEVAVAFRRIHDEMTYFNQDYRTAVERVAEATPSAPFSQFLTDMLSIINSGGDMTQFLEAEKDHQLQAVKQSQQARLDMLELFGQAYLSLSTVPMFALIVFVLMSMLGTPRPVMLYSVVYGLIPGLNILFIVLLSTVKKDEPGSGELEPRGDQTVTHVTETSLLDLDVVDEYATEYGDSPVFGQIRRQEIRYRLAQMLSLQVFKRRPTFTLFVTVPLALLSVGTLYGLGVLGPRPDTLLAAPIDSVSRAFEAAPLRQTFGWVLLPGIVLTLPLSLAYEWQQRSRATITDTLTADIRKMANANEAGNSVLESLRIAAEDNPSKLAGELRQAYKKVTYGHSLSNGLIELTNRYRQPRLARSIKLIERAQRASDTITGVLRTAAKLSETHDELDTEYESRMQQQVAILTVTFLVLLGVLVFLRVFFIPTIGELVSNNSNGATALTGSSMPQSTINLLYFHAALLQAVMTGLITGYIRKTSLYAGLKYVVVYTVLTAGIWLVIS